MSEFWVSEFPYTKKQKSSGGDKDFCLRIFGQLEKKITETEKGAKIARFVLPSTTMFTCFNRPENKNQAVCLHCIFFLFWVFFF